MTIALVIALLAVVLIWFLLARTTIGYEIRMIGANLKFTEYGGIHTRRVIALSMALSEGCWPGWPVRICPMGCSSA